jgi:hypothetical protein
VSAFHFEGAGVAFTFVLAVVAVAFLIGIVVAVGYVFLRRTDRARKAKSARATFLEALPYVFLLALVGGLTGQLGGGSREGVVGELVPAVMTLFGGFIAYFLGSKRDPSGKISVNTLAFLLGFFVMYNISAVWRQDNENWTFCRDLFANPEFSSEEQRQDRELYWHAYCGSVFEMWMTQPAATAEASPPATT